MRTTLFLTIIFFQSLVSLAYGEEITISGKATLDGGWARGQTLQVISNPGRPKLIRVENGIYQVKLDVTPGMTVAIYPYDDTWCSGSKKTVTGRGIVEIPEKPANISLDIELKTLPLVSKLIRVAAQDGRPVDSSRVSFSVKMDNPSKKAPPRVQRWNLKKMAEAKYLATIPTTGDGIITLKLWRAAKDGTRYVGENEIKLLDFRKISGDYLWTVKRIPVSLEVRFKWDPKFSDKPFVANVQASNWWYGVWIKGPKGRSTTDMNEKGLARFYELPPGEYTLGLKEIQRPKFVITQAPKSVTIPKDAKKPMVVDVFLKPAPKASADTPVAAAPAAVDFQGVVYQADGKTLVPKARLYLQPTVEAGRRYTILADEKGAFTGQILPGKYRLVIKRRYLRNGRPELPEGPKAPGTPTQRGALKVAVLDELIDIPQAGLKKNWTVGAAGVVKVSLPKSLPDGKNKSVGVLLLRPSDGQMIAIAAPDPKTKTLSVVAREGKYQAVLVDPKNKLAQVLGPVTVKRDKPVEITAMPGKWCPLTLSRDGKVKFE